MKSKKNIVLVGMMGSGKSTIGHILSKRMDVQFHDIDKVIEEEEGRKITEIFDTKGEDYFRIIEEKISLKFLKLNNRIISLGGGGFLNKRIRKEVVINHLSFWLNWNFSTIIKRANNSKNRPLLVNLSDEQIRKLIFDRTEIYEKAKFNIKCEKLNKNEIVKKIIDLYERN